MHDGLCPVNFISFGLEIEKAYSSFVFGAVYIDTGVGVVRASRRAENDYDLESLPLQLSNRNEPFMSEAFSLQKQH